MSQTDPSPEISRISRLDSGGPANLRGVAYQLISSLSEAARVRLALDTKHQGKKPTTVTLLIEPRGGGDGAVVTAGRREIHQVKYSSQTWSLNALGKGPMRDLFRAFETNSDAEVLQVLTNASFNTEAKNFCLLLDEPDADWRSPEFWTGSPPKRIPLKWFRPHGSERISATLVGLTDYFARRLGLPSGRRSKEGRARVGAFLSRLKLSPEISFSSRSRDCADFLRRFGVAQEDFEGTVDRAVGLLLRTGYSEKKWLSWDDISRELQLATTDLREWRELRSKCQHQVSLAIAAPSLKYVASDDVLTSDPLSRSLELALGRKAEESSGATLQTLSSPAKVASPIVLFGRSGMGKSWTMARAATQILSSERGPYAVWLASEQVAGRDLEQACRIFSSEIWGRERTAPLDSLARSVRSQSSETLGPWLTIFIDNVQFLDYFTDSALHSAARQGVQLVCAFTGEVSTEFAEKYEVNSIEAKGFASGDVLRFLERRGLLGAAVPPNDVRELLRVPAFCAIYVELSSSHLQWKPETEYQLLGRHWIERIAQPDPCSADALARLAFSTARQVVLSKSERLPTPWSWPVGRLREAGLTQADLHELQRRNILSRDSWARGYEFCLDRIFQQTVAEGAIRELQLLNTQSEEIVEFCVHILTTNHKSSQLLGYVPADLLWLLLDPRLPPEFASAAEAIVVELEAKSDFSRRAGWLATLGQRLLPIAERRLQALDARAIRRTWLDVLKPIEGERVTEIAESLVRDPRFEFQVLGVELLGQREASGSLDTLWALYAAWWAKSREPGARETPRGSIPGYYEASLASKALRRTLRKHPGWLERQLLKSPDLSRERAFLLYQLSSIDGGREIWFRAKDALREKAISNGQRAYASCVVAFLDEAEVGWLEARVNEQEDQLGAAARGALAMLKPQAAISAVESEALFDLAFARNWWLRPAWAANPSAAEAFFRELILHSEVPSQTARVFSGFELGWSPEVVAVVITAALDALRALADGTVKANHDPLFGPLRSLNACRSVKQLEHFWSAGARLDKALSDWLVASGPNEDRWERANDAQAISMLQMLAGSGMNRAGESLLLEAKTWTGGEQGLSLLRAPTKKQVRAIRKRALDSNLSSPPMQETFPVLQRLCALALAYHRDYEGFSLAVLQWGLAMPPDLIFYLDENRSQVEFLSKARSGVVETPVRPGALLLLGLHGGDEAVHVLFESNALLPLGNADLEVAWTSALGMTADSSARTMEALRARLNSDDDRVAFMALQGLLHGNRIRESADFLLPLIQDCSNNSELIARAYLEVDEYAPRVAEQLWRVRHQRNFLYLFSEQVECLAMLQTPEAGAFLRQLAADGSSHDLGARYSAIEGLLHLDPREAFRAALLLRSSKDSDDSCRWPALLLRSDRAKGLKVLEDELVSGKNRLTLFAVGDALRDYDGTRAIKTWLSSEKATLREGACIAACAQPFDRDLENSLVRLCFDQDAEVREAAVSAVEYSRRAKEVEVALERAKKVKRSGQRWALIDSILEIGYAGVEPFGHSSNWFDELVGGMPYFEYQYCRKRLLEKRKLLKKNLENSSENFRLDQD